MRLVYLGTPSVAVPPLVALHEAGHDIALVVTRADKRRGRGGAVQPSAVKQAALDLGLSVTSDLDDVLGIEADLGVVVAFGRIIPVAQLEHLPMVNLHFSLLPRWRGAAPVERAILAGDERTGVCLMDVAEELDTGDVHDRVELAIGADETSDELRERLVRAGTEMLVGALAHGLGRAEPQRGEVSYAEKITPEELALDWKRPAVELHRRIRVGNAWTTFRGKRLKVWRARVHDGEFGLEPGEMQGHRVGTGDGALELVEVHPEGRPRLDADAWLHGARPQADERLGQ
jgi:methionyl-tRNA formyltransferase